jgi:hypothetical protein
MADITTSANEADPTDFVNDKDEDAPVDEYAHGARLTAIVVSLLLGMFLVAIDNVGSSRICGSHNMRRKLTIHEDNHRNRHPKDHRRVPRPEQGVVVRSSVLYDLWW